MLSKTEARKIMLAIPGTDERLWFNQPSVFIHDRFLAKTHHKEDAVTLQVGSMEMRDMMLEAEPKLFYITDHYRKFPFVLVRLSTLTATVLKEMLVGRAAQLAAMPPLPTGAAPWLSSLHFAMTFDVVLFGSLYMIAFVAALRRVPLFPRLLAAIWIGDLTMQLFTAELVTRAGGLPPAVASALHGLLDGNVKKVLISAALWLPYLLMSKRVNVTYRHRVPA